jgi:hypothetical protein
VIASSLTTPAKRAAVEAEARSAHVDTLDASVDKVVQAQGDAPTAAFVAVDLNQAGADLRVATLVISQPAGEALSAQRSVLQRMFLTALAALLLVVLLAILLARRIADPVRRLTVAAGRVRRGDDEVHLTVTEFRLLSELASPPGRVLSRQALLDRVWDRGFFGDERIVDVHVRRLRKKLECEPSSPTILITVRGLGYRLDLR